MRRSSDPETSAGIFCMTKGKQVEDLRGQLGLVSMFNERARDRPSRSRHTMRIDMIL